MLLPGEIEDLSRAVERLCGFRRITIDEVKKRLTEGGDTELELVYYLFHKHHWTPEMYYGMGQGGRDLTLAFASMSWKREGTQIERRAATRAAPTWLEIISGSA